MELKEFKDYLSTYGDADKILSTPIVPCVRINTLKISKNEFFEISSLNLKKTFYEFGYYFLEEKIKPGTTWEYFLGYLHPQSLSSMLPSLVLAPSEFDIVLDAAAAPGSKTSHMSMIMKNRGAILACENKWERASILFSNLARLGALNVKVAVKDSTKLPFKNYFSKALADVPCSSLAENFAYLHFKIENLNKLIKIQEKIILAAFDSLKVNGELVYSTCTYEKRENEEIVKFLLEKRENAKLIPLGFEFDHESGLSEYGHEFRKVARIYPYHFNSQGFFIAKIKKVFI